MRTRFSIYTRILCWFALNLLFVSGVAYLVFRFQFKIGLDSVLLGRAADRMKGISELILFELNRSPQAEWNEILKRFSDAQELSLGVFRPDGVQLAGDPIALPKALTGRLSVARGASAGPGMPPERPPRPGFEGEGPPPFGGRRGGRGFGGPPAGAQMPPFFLRTDNPTKYWVGVRMPVRNRENIPPGPMVLLGVSSNLYGKLFDPVPWIAAGLGVIGLSALFWAPLVRGMTRSIHQVMAATERAAEGDFSARVPEGRSDELGRLAESVNLMTSRLAGYVNGQKRFLGDISHELCAPIARLQVALGILEQRAEDGQRPYLEDLKEELSQMSSLVNELLSFSKAGLQAAGVNLQTVQLSELCRQVVERELPGNTGLELSVPQEMTVEAEPQLLARALGNVLRNAIRHGGAGGRISLTASEQNQTATLFVRDEGPGVPEHALQKIFDPFYRVDDSRTRETGGAGLGLAIVKTCVEACRGKVHARNLQPCGLEVIMEFPRKP